MAEKGKLFLKNSTVTELYDATNTYGTTVQSALYEQYKTAYKIAASNYFRGNAADTFKTYVTNATINILTEMMDVAADMTMISQLFALSFLAYESTATGRVKETVLTSIEEILQTKEEVFNDAMVDVESILKRADEYISRQTISSYNVNAAYTSTRIGLASVRQDLYTLDDEALTAANGLYDRIMALQTMIQELSNYCYTNDGVLNADCLDSIPLQDWYQTAGNLALSLMLEEDPFVYAAGETTFSENQWAVGLCADVYAYRGYSFLSASGEYGVEDGAAFAKGAASVLEVNVYAQATDYLAANADLAILYATGEAKIGFSDEYVGASASGEIGAAKAEASAVLGIEEANIYAQAEASAACADGKVAFEFEEDGEFAIGAIGSATAVGASASVGFSLFEYEKTTYDKTGKKKSESSLLSANVEAKASVGAGAGVYLENDLAIETDIVNVYALSLDVELEALLGLELSVTLPVVVFQLPW